MKKHLEKTVNGMTRDLLMEEDNTFIIKSATWCNTDLYCMLECVFHNANIVTANSVKTHLEA